MNPNHRRKKFQPQEKEIKNNKKKLGEFTNMCKFNCTPKQGMSKEIIKYFELNEKQQNLGSKVVPNVDTKILPQNVAN